ncbi:hypothetical protein OAY28_06940 [Gammaproteobacteria bacterium]|nr:hypothetical protein [Gammaproteobacteria bacterium]MDC0922481.1 hypothetical protein [Gammaproteobacteria bacterium]MDC3382041.1 hypothetical protein [Gammaproteobacteria bacterium]
MNPTKGLRGRTNQGKRGFGGELDEMLPGKLLEIAVCRILENFSSNNKRLFPDFKIYSNFEVGKRSDPDITKVHDYSLKKDRPPNIFVEIKRYDPNAKWMGPRQHQLKDMTEGYMIHASIEFNDQSSLKQRDITASVLKRLIKTNLVDLNEFADFEDLVAKIEYVYSFKDLKSKGHFFESGNIIPETEFPKSRNAYKKDGSLSTVYRIVNDFDGIDIPMQMKWENKDIHLNFGAWNISGNFQILKDNKTNKEFIFAKKNVTMFSNIFGLFKIPDGDTHRFFITNKLGTKGGKDIFKSIDDYWFAKKRLDELLANDEIPDTLNAIDNLASKI